MQVARFVNMQLTLCYLKRYLQQLRGFGNEEEEENTNKWMGLGPGRSTRECVFSQYVLFCCKRDDPFLSRASKPPKKWLVSLPLDILHLPIIIFITANTLGNFLSLLCLLFNHSSFAKAPSSAKRNCPATEASQSSLSPFSAVYPSNLPNNPICPLEIVSFLCVLLTYQVSMIFNSSSSRNILFTKHLSSGPFLLPHLRELMTWKYVPASVIRPPRCS